MKTLAAVALFVCSSAFAGIVQPVTSAPQLLIPAAGSTPGANGTFFRSEIGIANFADRDQLVKLQWLPQGFSSTFSKTITLNRFGFVRSTDFVAEVLGQTGLGAILVTGITASGDVDQDAKLFARSRIWTPQPGTDGTTSQNLPAIPTSAINTADAMIVFPGVTGGGNFRTNVGIVNIDPNNAQTFSVTISFGPLGGFSLPVTVPPMSMQQAILGTGSFFPELPIVNTTSPATKSNLWVAYASTIDNVTGDAWSDLAVAGAPLLSFPVPIGKN